jgi:hypothetical protein
VQRDRNPKNGGHGERVGALRGRVGARGEHRLDRHRLVRRVVARVGQSAAAAVRAAIAAAVVAALERARGGAGVLAVAATRGGIERAEHAVHQRVGQPHQPRAAEEGDGRNRIRGRLGVVARKVLKGLANDGDEGDVPARRAGAWPWVQV